ncbi:hypothetical protein [Pseudomonas soli]|uniref:hypothetical protein n=1 Tax=Pseudomonas soli TaxID=1306993 RepID=UPI00345DFEF9
MARPFQAPDPRDRSVNEPTQVVSAAQVIGLHNQENPTNKKERVVDSVKDWYKQRMKSSGWHDAEFHGNQAVLTAKVTLG